MQQKCFLGQKHIIEKFYSLFGTFIYLDDLKIGIMRSLR